MRLDPELRFASVRQLGQALLPLATPPVRARWAHEFGPRDAPPADDTAVSVSLPSKASIPPANEPASKASRSSGVGLGLVALGLMVAAAAGAVLTIGNGQRLAASQEARTAALESAPPAAHTQPPSAGEAPHAAAELAAAQAPAISPPRAAEVSSVTVPAERSPATHAPAATRRPMTTTSLRAAPSKHGETGTNDAPIVE
jgi:hypothetical protein